tara:strand:+ start:981 stop:1370 length:390 start_codon:yes stop_codon:yes gene_type:complete
MELSKEEFLKKTDNLMRNTLAIDFDGVIHNHHLGYHDGTIYGNPIPGALEAIKMLYKKGYRIVIFTCKANPQRPLINKKSGPKLIREWLDKHNISKYVEDITYDKINALYYIDDKAITFKNWDNILNKL